MRVGPSLWNLRSNEEEGERMRKSYEPDNKDDDFQKDPIMDWSYQNSEKINSCSCLYFMVNLAV